MFFFLDLFLFFLGLFGSLASLSFLSGFGVIVLIAVAVVVVLIAVFVVIVVAVTILYLFFHLDSWWFRISFIVAVF